MNIEEILTLISCIASLCCDGCLIALWVMIWRQSKAMEKPPKKILSDIEALQHLREQLRNNNNQ